MKLGDRKIRELQTANNCCPKMEQNQKGGIRSAEKAWEEMISERASKYKNCNRAGLRWKALAPVDYRLADPKDDERNKMGSRGSHTLSLGLI